MWRKMEHTRDEIQHSSFNLQDGIRKKEPEACRNKIEHRWSVRNSTSKFQSL